MAGQDAVPAALEFIIRQLSARPEIQSQLRAELLTAVPLASADRNYAMIDDLPYLNAVVMESLRLVDTISSYQTRVVPKGGCEISGYYIPAGVGHPYLILSGFKPLALLRHLCIDNCLLPAISHKSSAHNLPQPRSIQSFPLDSPT